MDATEELRIDVDFLAVKIEDLEERLEGLEKENAALKATIYNGIRVKVSSTETKLYDEIHVWYGEGANATLILWENPDEHRDGG